MDSSGSWIRTNVDMARAHLQAKNFAVSIALCESVLRTGASVVDAAECHIMLATSQTPDAMDHAIEANTILREAMDEQPDNEVVQDMLLISQDVLRSQQAIERALRAGDFDTANAIASVDHFANMPAGSSVPLFPGSPTNDRSRSRHRRRVSDIDLSLSPVREEKADPNAKFPAPTPPPRLRRMSSLSRAAQKIADRAK